MSATVDANSMYDPDADVRAQGSVLASAVVALLREMDEPDVVVVNFKGVRGAASSYFNVFLFEVARTCGHSALLQRLKFEFGSTPQKLVFERSKAAVLRELGN